MSEPKNRTLFGQPIREETTGLFFPKEISLEEFCERILDNKEAFMKNMKTICGNEQKFVEDWFETFAAWSEIE